MQVLSQQQAELMSNEQELMDSDCSYVVREVLLYGQQTPWVFARSLLPETLCEGEHMGLSSLGNKPLGSLIFNDPRFIRQPFQITRIDSDNKLYQQLQLSTGESLWGRRSVFLFQKCKLMVAEIFLPQSPAYKLMGRTV